MNRWPEGALSREEVSELLQSPVRWRVEWCSGSRMAPEIGRGTKLPHGVLERIPTGSKRRKFRRGLDDEKTWIFASLAEQGSETVLILHEGP